MEPGNQTGSDIIHPLVDRQTGVKKLPCPNSFVGGNNRLASMLRHAYETILLTPNVMTPPSLEHTTSLTSVREAKLRTTGSWEHYKGIM